MAWKNGLSDGCWEKENTARKTGRFEKPKKEMAFIRRFASDDQFPYFSATNALNQSMWKKSDENDLFDLPTPLTMYSLNKKGRWNCLSKFTKIAAPNSTERYQTMQKHLHRGRMPTGKDQYTTASEKFEGRKHRLMRKATQERAVRSASVDSKKGFVVCYEIVKTHPSNAIWNNFAKENTRLGKIFGSSGGGRRQRAKQLLIERPSREELQFISSISTAKTTSDLSSSSSSGIMTADQRKTSPEAPIQRQPLVIPLIDCIRLKPQHKNKKAGVTNDAKGNNNNNKKSANKEDSWEMIDDNGQSEFDVDWELV